MTFERAMPAFRYADTFFNDDLRHIALRELGDASRWAEIALLNGLKPPYLVSDPALVTDGVILCGKTILVPASQSSAGITADPDAVFGIDLLLVDGRVQFDNGDLAVTSGSKNLIQSIKHRLATHTQDLIFHPNYGNLTYKILGKNNGTISGQLAAFYTKSALLNDTRIDRVLNVTVEIVKDAILVDAVVVAISGQQLKFNMEL